MKYELRLGFTTYVFEKREREKMCQFIDVYMEHAICDTITESAPPEIKIIVEEGDFLND